MATDEFPLELKPDELPAGRAELLTAAVDALDARGGHLGPGKRRSTKEGAVALDFNEDVAELVRPEILPLDLAHLAAEEQIERSELLKRWRFYWLKFPLNLWTRPGWGFNQLEFRADFNADAPEDARPRVHDAIPTQEYATIASAKVRLSVGVGGDFRFAAEIPPVDLNAAGIPAELQAKLKADAGGEVGFAVAPRPYEVRVPIVRRSNADLDTIRWRLEGGRMVQEQDPGLRVVLKVPHGTDTLDVRAAMRARRNWNSFDSDLQGIFLSLNERFRSFFTRGAPIADSRLWGLSDQLVRD